MISLNFKQIIIRREQSSMPKKIFYILIVLALFMADGSNLFAQTDDDCLSCHSDNELSMVRQGKTISLYVDKNVLLNSSHRKLSCVSCHKDFSAEEIPHKENIEPIKCSSCHKDAAVKHSFHPKMFRVGEKFDNSALNCKGCHGTHDVISTKNKKSIFYVSNLTDACGNCHTDVRSDFKNCLHYKSLSEGNPFAPNCLTCHKAKISKFYVAQDSLKAKIAQEKLCLACHLEKPEVSEKVATKVSFIKAYENSVHGQALLKGNAKAANCIDCHSSHLIIKSTDEKSPVAKFNVVQTCGKCHDEIAKEFTESIHGVALLRRNIDSPTCTDCHGEHNILSPQDPRAPVAFRNVSVQVCSPCHSSVRLTERYGLSTRQVATFETSYHGLALRGGATEAANCASCHGYHNIKPSTDSTSMIHKSNLVKTCGKCHPGANERFAMGKIHITETDREEPIIYWISTIYIILIITIVGGMSIHNILDFIKRAKRRKMIQRGLIKQEYHGHSLYLRMTVNERVQHFLLLISFIILVITGFALRFPEAWWVRHLRDLIPGFFDLRSLLHRISAVVLVAVSIYHIFYLSFTERGRQLFKDLLPNIKDVKDAIGVFKYNIGLSPVKPKLDRFSYAEKAEYWAVIWGTIVMTITGIIMWFENTFIGIFTKLGYDIARTIHYFEAWLAFLSILVWHFYFVLFNPDVYPMSLTWIKGYLTEEEMAEEHPLELERIKKQENEIDSQNDAENK